MFSTCTSTVFQHSYLWISSGSSSNGNPCVDGVTGSQEHLKAVWSRCLWDAWCVAVLRVLIPLLLLQLGACPSAVTRGLQGELSAKKQWQRKEWRTCLQLVDLLMFHCLANTNVTVCVIAALVFYSNLMIALFWASEERWEVTVLRNKKIYRNHVSLPFQHLFLLSEKIAEWLGCLLYKMSWFKS